MRRRPLRSAARAKLPATCRRSGGSVKHPLLRTAYLCRTLDAHSKESARFVCVSKAQNEMLRNIQTYSLEFAER